MDVGPLVVSHTQAAKLIQPGERPLHDPAKLTEAAPMPRAARGQQRDNVARPQPSPDGLRVVRAVAQHAVGTTAGSSSLALE